jgi:hypothetical protein
VLRWHLLDKHPLGKQVPRWHLLGKQALPSPLPLLPLPLLPLPPWHPLLYNLQQWQPPRLPQPL